MTKKKPVEWSRLDNAAKIFPPNSNEKDTKVFRFVAELMDDIDEQMLQEAVEKTVAVFPFYQSVLRKGVFWYYLENTDILPRVKEENKLPCSMLYYPNRRNLLFEVTYYKKRVNLEVFHALTDGTGALGFLKTLLYFYIIKRYEEDFVGKFPKLDYDASIAQKMDDSFLKHYSGKTTSNKIKITKAHHILGRRPIDNRIKIIEGTMSVKEIIQLAHEHDTTLTVYLTALFIYSIYQEMSVRNRRLPIVLSIPVNLRSYFPSVTARNFFGTIYVSYNFSKSGNDLDNIIKEVKEGFQRELTQEKLEEHMNKLAALEHNAFARVVPLSIKDFILRMASSISDRGITASVSNIGKITVPGELAPYIKLFDCFTSARRPQICMCSFGDQLVVSFTSPFVGTDIQKNFFRMLTEQNVQVTIVSNTKDNM
ncbi:MAG: hypothetical protein K0S47_2550 [Herbinix sp.]|jgi:NRPS condensation-like uncharacterized protein|nr:hypothetical protein [Herbinix sp.]